MDGAQHDLFEPGEYLIAGRPGYFSVLTKHGQRKAQESYPLEQLVPVVESANPDIDTYISQAIFTQPNRRSVNLRDVGLLFVDLDTYKEPRLLDKTPGQLVELFLDHCQAVGLPLPSIIRFNRTPILLITHSNWAGGSFGDAFVRAVANFTIVVVSPAPKSATCFEGHDIAIICRHLTPAITRSDLCRRVLGGATAARG